MFAKWHDGQEGDLALKLQVWSQVGFFSCYSRGDLYVTKGGGKRLFRVAEGERS